MHAAGRESHLCLFPCGKRSFPRSVVLHTPLNFDSRYLFLAWYALKIPAHFFDVCAVSVGIPIRQEMLVAVVGMLNAMRVPEGAPVLFRAPRDFHYESAINPLA
jgi:hypothetical protein